VPFYGFGNLTPPATDRQLLWEIRLGALLTALLKQVLRGLDLPLQSFQPLIKGTVFLLTLPQAAQTAPKSMPIHKHAGIDVTMRGK
jgi:hypothetical protein